jgi:hypothetical protein
MKKSYPMGVKDLSSLLKQAKSLDVNALVGFSYPDECMLLTGQAMELGINFKVFALSVGPAFTFYRMHGVRTRLRGSSAAAPGTRKVLREPNDSQSITGRLRAKKWEITEARSTFTLQCSTLSRR